VLREGSVRLSFNQEGFNVKAAVMYKPGDIRVEDVAKPEVKPGHALVRVAACGVCGSDIPRMLSKGAHRMPLICGHEFAGFIEQIGTGVEGYSPPRTLRLGVRWSY